MKDWQTAITAFTQQRIPCEEHKDLKDYTTLHIGGKARMLIKPQSIAQIQTTLHILQNAHIPYAILGNGSNVLALDEGYDGAIIVLSSSFHRIWLDETHRLHAQSGAALKALSAFAAAQGLSGLEFACGIPGSVGGGIFMNAGAYGGEIKDVIETVTYVNAEGALKQVTKEAMGLSYRHSMFQDTPCVILEATFVLQPHNKEAICARMEDLMERRRQKQPLDQYSAGSTFQRPPGHYASALIKDAQLMGVTIGDAQVSEKHAGFLINKKAASSEDFLALIKLVQERVQAHSGVMLEREIKILKP